MEKSFEELCGEIRENSKKLEKECREMMVSQRFESSQSFVGQHSEMKANLMLAIRHFEDARMRIGKVLQYNGDGVSIFDK